MQDDVRVYTPPSGKAPDATPTTLLNTNEDALALGALDAAFARYPARVQLLLVVDAKIDERRFRDAVDAAIVDIALGPVRLNGGSGCALSAVEHEDEALFSQKPPSPLLFTREPCAAPLAWRLSVGPTKSAVGLSFDHALTDVGGAVLLLKRASRAYTQDPPLALSLDRSCQSDVAALRADTPLERIKPQKGGCLVVDFASRAEAAAGRTRHAVLFADLVAVLNCVEINVLREAGASIDTLSFARDCRGRQVPSDHFGNASVLVEMPADAPLIDYVNAPGVENCLASVHVTSWARVADGTYFGGRAAMAVRGRRPVSTPSTRRSSQDCAPRGDGVGAPRRHRRVAARVAAIGMRGNTQVGPATLKAAAAYCAARGGQPNITIVPDGDGLRVLLVAPTDLAKRVAQVLRKRASQRPVVVFFRGVGDLSDAWAARLRGAWDVVLPEPPSHEGWFPLALPVTEAVAVPPEVIGAARRVVDAYSGRKVVVGGFSQGGALALAVASSRLKGVVAVSAWASSEKVAAPTLFSCGTADPTVLFSVSKASGLRLHGATVKHVQRARHGPTNAELEAVRSFIGDCLTPKKGGCAACGAPIDDEVCRYRCVHENCDDVIQCAKCSTKCARCDGSLHEDRAAPLVLRRELFREVLRGNHEDPRSLLERTFDVYAARPLIGENNEWWTYAQCGRAAKALASKLPDDGIVCIHGRNSKGWLIADWACALKRAPSLAVDASVSVEEAHALACRHDSLTCALVDDYEAWCALDGTLSVMRLADHSSIVKTFTKRPSSEPVTCLLTLGSTGSPKPLKFSADDWADWCGSSVKSKRERNALERRSVRVSCQALVAPLAHGLSRRMAWSEVLHGGRLGICDTRGDVVAQIRKYAPTHLSGAPRFYSLYRGKRGALLAGPRLRFVAVGGAAVPRSLITTLKKLFPEAAVSDGYGMSEVPGGIARDGKVLSGVTVKISEDGEILVKTARGRIRNVEEGAWFHTGDLGRFVDGRLEVLDRKSDCVKLENGEWLSPQRVENALESCGSIGACVVIARAGWAAPVAVVVTEASLEEVEEEARGCTLAPWEVPRFILRRDPFDEKECSAHGKVRRHVVAANHNLIDVEPSLVERTLKFLAAPYTSKFGEREDWWAAAGGDSVAAARLAGTWTGAPIAVGDVLRLAPRDLHRKAHGCCEEDLKDWARECATTPHSVTPRRGSAVLLTGATGLLGPHLLKELEGRDLWVLCRPPAARLSTTATVLEADLAREDLGLSADDLKRLRAAGIATIVHSAASVDAQKTYDELRDVNVESLGRLVHACASSPRVVLVSTLSVVPKRAEGWDGVGLVPPACAETLETGYARSKLVAEHRLSALRVGGVVARLGLLDGPGNWLELTLAACVAIGAAPEGLPQFVGVLSPKVAASRLIRLVDEASSDILFVDVDATSCGVAPVSVHDRLAALGVSERLPYEAWRRKCAEAGGAAGARAVAALPPSGGFPSGARRRLREIRSSLVVV